MNEADLVRLQAIPVDPVIPYHKGRSSRPDRIPPETRRFIAWDGEGANLNGDGRPQSYVLFGCSAEGFEPLISEGHLHTLELLDYIISVGRTNPDGIHVGFAFGYDTNMIVKSLQRTTLEKLHKEGSVYINPRGRKYRLEYRPGKSFRVTKYDDNYDHKTNRHAKFTVTIYDLFSFFAQSFVGAYEKLVGPVPQIVLDGKSERNVFRDKGIAYVKAYWEAEILCLQQLAEELRKRLYGADLRITQWHGPGALASYSMRKHDIREAMAESPKEVRDASRYAYAGGRFEMFRLGRTLGPIYSLDINSAYPYGITKLPNLSRGTWVHRRGSPPRVARFGVYRIRFSLGKEGSLRTEPGPLFHRDNMGRISFPWTTEGWYWSPEILNIVNRIAPEHWEIVEYWEFKRTGSLPMNYPFEWVSEMYDKRKEWKRKGYASELALKLCMNSLYGKMAQRVGWNEEKRTAPQWHQLEWAGWVTSNCRAMLWDVMSRFPNDSLLAVETDGLYTTADPATLGIETSDELGGWEIEQYDEILYVQSGLAWLRKGDKWICKRRGLDARTFTLDQCRSYLRSLEPNIKWEPYVGSATRFVGLGAALASPAPLGVRHCLWDSYEREIRPGQNGKRVHIYRSCRACGDGKSAYESAHDMRILSRGGPNSHPHDIPWEDDCPTYHWREALEIEEGLIKDV